MGLRIKVEIVETKVFHGEILLSDQPFFEQLTISLIFGRAAKFLPFASSKRPKWALSLK